MKRLLLLITICITSVSYQLYSQSCTPGVNFQDSLDGIWPDTIQNLPPIGPNLPYSANLNFKFSDHPGQLPSGLTLYSFNDFTLDSVSGLPPGLNFVCSDPNCYYLADSVGCLNIWGISPTNLGTYPIKIHFSCEVLVQIFGIPTPLIVTDSLTGYNIVVQDCSGQTTTSNLSVTECDTYTAPSGALYTNTQVVNDYLVNTFGCDSIITIDLTINNSSFSNITAFDCNSYTLNNQTYNSSGTYTQIVTNNAGCDSTITLDLIITSNNNNYQEVCAVGTYNGNNRVVWEKPITTVIDSFYIYRESTQSGIYDLIGATAYSDSALFTDSNSDPSVQAYRYKISSVDTCGNESPLSQEHKTIHLTINQGVGSDWNLIWSQYEGFSFTTYEIYRGTNPSNMIFLTSIQNTLNSYTDQSAPAGNIYYQIVAVNPNGCNPAKSTDYSSSKSNIANTSETSSITELVSQVLIHPNPTSTSFTITSKNSINSSFKLIDIQGKVVLKGKIESTEETVDISKLSKGQYNLVFEDENISPISIIKN